MGGKSPVSVRSAQVQVCRRLKAERQSQLGGEGVDGRCRFQGYVLVANHRRAAVGNVLPQRRARLARGGQSAGIAVVFQLGEGGGGEGGRWDQSMRPPARRPGAVRAREHLVTLTVAPVLSVPACCMASSVASRPSMTALRRAAKRSGSARRTAWWRRYGPCWLKKDAGVMGARSMLSSGSDGGETSGRGKSADGVCAGVG